MQLHRFALGVFVLFCSGVGAAQTTTTATQTSPTKQTLVPPPKRDVPGTRIKISSGTLYIPEYYRASLTSGTELLVFFHGAAWVAEQNFHDARKNAVLVCVSLAMEKYGSAFAMPGALETLIAQTEGALSEAKVSTAPVSKICLSSFSGGYSAVREILRSGARAEQVSDVVLADSLYGSRVPGNDKALVTTATQPFLDFARSAARSGDRRRFFFSQLFPPEEQHRGNTTTVAAYYLTDELGVPRTPAEGKSSRGAKLLYRADKNGFHVLGYAGMTTQDHFEHFYAIGDLWKQTSLTDAHP